MQNSSVCIVGAGPSGLTTLKTLREAGIENVTCFEASDQIGGNWVFREKGGHGSVYETTHIISSKHLSEYSDFPMPADFPFFPSHTQVLKYHQDYAANFGISNAIDLNTNVISAEQADNGSWQVIIAGPDGKKALKFDHLIVCSGHHWDPCTPDYPGKFEGKMLHAHDYRKAAPYKNKQVLIVGAGNSACDIACAVAPVATSTRISMRSGQYIFPKMLFGRPVDKMFDKVRSLPKWAIRAVSHLALKMTIGPYGRYGLPTPKSGILSMHPTLNSEIFGYLTHGILEIRPGIKKFEAENVVFSDGTREQFDTIIWATGYRTSFPFLPEGLLDFDPNVSLPLYMQIVPANVANLFFIGLLQPWGCIWKLSEIQARYVAGLIKKTNKLPKNIKHRIEQDVVRRKRQFPGGTRHLAEVHQYDYMKQMQELIDREA
ncbi:MAG: NAD(P)-binding domain-containing protein [Rhizobiales bacterium]|nr:NAD(P)-binding domain-containing protein [Hyphomicrobiales bacterium]